MANDIARADLDLDLAPVQGWCESSAWQEIARSHGVARTLDALDWIHDHIRAPESGEYRRLRVLVPGLAGPSRKAAERILLDVRRSCAAGEVRTLYEHGDGDDTLESQLYRGTLEDKMTWIEAWVSEERFERARQVAAWMLQEENGPVRAALARALGRLGGGGTMNLLRAAARAPDRDVRLGAVFGLEHRCGRPAVRLLLERLADQDSRVRQQADQALLTFSPRHLRELLVELPPERGSSFLEAGRLWLMTHGFG